MTTAAFPGDSRYTAVLTASRSGFTISANLKVNFSGGSGAWSTSPVQGWSSTIAGNTTTGTWTYDFRSTTSITVWSRSRTVSGPGGYTVYGWADMVDGKGRGQPGTITISVPPNAPAAPSALSVARVSDTSQTVTWTRNATVAAPYYDQQVQRAEQQAGGVWSAWTAVSTISTDYTNSAGHSVSNTNTVANRMYQYRIKASNTAAEAYSAVYQYVFTTPAAPSAFTAVKEASGSITLSLTQAISHSLYQTVIEYSLNGGSSWTALTTLNSGVTSYNWASPPAGSAVIFQARTVVVSAGDPGNGLTSAWKLSNSVALTAPPNAPSNLAPNGLVFDSSGARVFTWLHNPVDSSVQSAYEIQYRIVGAGAWTSTGKITSGTQSRTFAASTFVNGNNYEWQVRTYGAHATASAWSSTSTFTTSAPPSVSIVAPGPVLGESTLLLDWSFSDPESTAQSMWEAQLLRDGQTIEALSNSGSTTDATFVTRLADATEYQVQVRGRDGTGLWSDWDQQTFTTDFPTPNVPLITDAVWSPQTGTTMLTVSNPAGGEAVISNDVLRSLDGGATWELVGDAPVDGIGFDPTIPLGVDATYKVVAWTDLPSSSESAEVVVNTNYVEGVYIGPVGGFWSAGAGFVNVVRLNKGRGNPPSMDLTTGMAQRTLHYFAGRTKPVETVGEATLREGKVEFIISTVEEMRSVRNMALLPAPHLIRLPDGTLLFGSIGEVDDKRLAEGWYQISFPITEVDQ